MHSIDQLQAFIYAAEEGSFSAAARTLGKAQSAVSTAVINLEIDTGVELFDRSGRNPQLTEAGKVLLDHARSVLQSNREFMAQATSLSEGIETRICIAIEQGIFVPSLLEILDELGNLYPFVEVDLLEPGTNDVAGLLIQGRADIGLMMEQEGYPQGFFFRGVGHSRLIPACGRDHPLATLPQVSHADLRQHRQLIARSRSVEDTSHLRERKSAKVWYSESPYVILDLLTAGMGWALLPQTVLARRLERGDLVRLHYSFQQTEILQGVDVVWTEHRALGSVGQWLLGKLLSLTPELWSAPQQT